MTTQLIKYEAACRALAECKSLDEVKTWADKAAAMQAYGRMANDRSMEVDAAEIRIRAERRLGEMIASSDLQKGGRPSKETGRQSRPVSTPTLAQAGISKDLSSRAQKLAAVPEAEFEAELAAKRERDQEEGARISAKLQKSGERHMQAEADDGPSAEELADAERAQADDAERIAIMLESDDALAALHDKYAQLQAQNRILSQRVAGLMNEKNEAIKLVKSLRRQLAKEAA